MGAWGNLPSSLNQTEMDRIVLFQEDGEFKCGVVLYRCVDMALCQRVDSAYVTSEVNIDNESRHVGSRSSEAELVHM